MPRFTVLLPTHDRADVIGYAIQSILAQTERDFELLVVGDGCTDGTAAVVAAFDDPRIRWFDLPKAPHSGYANRNIVLRQASGQLIAYAQHDDLMLPDHLALLGEAVRGDIDWAYSRPLWVTTDGIVVPSGTNLTLADELVHFLQVRNTIPSNCVVHRRDCLERFGYWPEDAHQVADWLLWRKIVGAVGRERIAYVPVGTGLHFSATWKKSRHSGLPEVATWLAVIERTGWWPQALRRTISSAPEQRVWLEALQDDPGLVKALRAAIDLVIDRQAWSNVLHTLPRIDALELTLAQHASSVAMADAEVRDLQTQLRETQARNETIAAELEAARTQTARLEASLRDALKRHERATQAAQARARSLEAGLQASRAHATALRRGLLEGAACLTRALERTRLDRDESRAAACRAQQARRDSEK